MKKVRQYTPQNYEQQEEAKEKAYPILYSKYGKYSFEEKMKAAFVVMLAHFDRSFENAIQQRYTHQHPSFEEYIAMMDYTGVIPSDVWQAICEKYGRNPGHIAPGCTDWFPPESESRKEQFFGWQQYIKRKERREREERKSK